MVHGDRGSGASVTGGATVDTDTHTHTADTDTIEIRSGGNAETINWLST